jgi:hypothetical protein
VGVESAPLGVVAELVVFSPEASGFAAPTSPLFLLASGAFDATGLTPVVSPDAPATLPAGEAAAVAAVFWVLSPWLSPVLPRG